jgi:hypothetical protein
MFDDRGALLPLITALNASPLALRRDGLRVILALTLRRFCARRFISMA